jgi:uncharacterized protein
MAYRVSIRSLSESLAASMDVSGEITMPDIEMGAQPYRFETPASFELTITNAGAGIVASGTARVVVTTPCVRCLCDTSIPVEADVDGFYVLPGHDDEFSEEQEIEYIADDSTIDVEPAVVQALVVELPFAPLHDEDCKGICPVCGADRNITECDCVTPGTPSPFDALKDLHVGDEDGA